MLRPIKPASSTGRSMLSFKMKSKEKKRIRFWCEMDSFSVILLVVGTLSIVMTIFVLAMEGLFFVNRERLEIERSLAHRENRSGGDSISSTRKGRGRKDSSGGRISHRSRPGTRLILTMIFTNGFWALSHIVGLASEGGAASATCQAEGFISN